MTGDRARPWRVAATMYSVLPVPCRGDVDGRVASRALLWLPPLGVVLALLAAIPAVLVHRGAPLLAAVLAVGALALLTRGLHLDGAADLADGLGSRSPAARALVIMRQSDIGPFGVVAVVFCVLVQVAALSSLLGEWTRPQCVVALVTAVVIGRIAVLWGAGTGIPAAHPDGFGALVAGSVPLATRALMSLAALALSGLAGAAAGLDAADVARLAGAGAVGLLAADLLRRHAVRRLGGMTGDVFGALVETATGTTLAVLVVALSWR